MNYSQYERQSPTQVLLRQAAPNTTSQQNDLLDGWKEIAAYMGRSTRCVQRWENSLGLPVHRLMHDRGYSAYAYRQELDSWRRNREVKSFLPPVDLAVGTEPEAMKPKIAPGDELVLEFLRYLQLRSTATGYSPKVIARVLSRSYQS